MIVSRMCLPRRTMLRGLGVSIALPLLDGMIPALTAVRKTAAAPAPRFAAFYIPMGANMDMWTPTAEGRGVELSPILQPLAPFRDQVLVASGLDSREAEPREEDSGGVHTRCQATWLTGMRAYKTAGADLRLGVSMDQIAARQIGTATQVTSLELALEAVDVVGACDYGYTCAYTSTLAWRAPNQPLPMEVSPREVFERLFGDTTTTDPKARARRMRKDGSILDSVTAEIGRLESGLGPQDKAKLSEYLQATRDIERRIQKAEEQGSRELPVVRRPAGVPSAFEDHAKLMFDLLVLAFQSDITRISTFMVARELSGRTYPEIGITEPHHPLSHHANNPEKLAAQAKLNTFHVRLFAHLVEKLKSTPDGDGSLLDHTVLLYGSGMSNSNEHKYLDLPILALGGKGLGLKGGQHVRYPKGTPLASLQLALLDRLGVHVDRLGDSNGELNLASVG